MVRIHKLSWVSIILSAVILTTCIASSAIGQTKLEDELYSTVVGVEKASEARLSYVISDIFTVRLNLKIEFDKDAFRTEKREFPSATLVKLPKIENISLETLVRLSLAAGDATYEVRGDTIFVVPARKNGQLRRFPAMSQSRRELIKKQREALSALPEVRFDAPIEADLRGVLNCVGRRFDVLIVIDEFSFLQKNANDNVSSKTAKLPAMVGTLDTVLKTIIRQVHADYELHGDHIRIVPRDSKES